MAPWDDVQVLLFWTFHFSFFSHSYSPHFAAFVLFAFGVEQGPVLNTPWSFMARRFLDSELNRAASLIPY
jgi:hypothetical protein